MDNENTVTYVIANNLGGITSLILNLVHFRGTEAFPQELVVLDIAGNLNAPIIFQPVTGLTIKRFSLHPAHNWYTVFKRLAATVGKKDGVLVSNDTYDLIMATYYNIPKKIVQIVHDAYNVKLSLQFEEVIDAFICHSQFYYEALRQLLHHRQEDIVYLPYGIPLSGTSRNSRRHKGPLQLLFLGRHDKNKGVFDLHKIHIELRKRNIAVNWLILGKGPETEALKEQWKNEDIVRFLTPASNEEVLQLAGKCDIFVFPTKFEGFPVAMLEAMSVGCLPIVSDLPGGIRESVENGKTGFRCRINEIRDFVDKIQELNEDRDLMEDMSKQAFDKIHSTFNAEVQSPKYQQLFIDVAKREGAPRHHLVKRKIGSRLDQPWLHNSIVRLLRRN